jgi:hypothetical protein
MIDSNKIKKMSDSKRIVKELWNNLGLEYHTRPGSIGYKWIAITENRLAAAVKEVMDRHGANVICECGDHIDLLGNRDYEYVSGKYYCANCMDTIK